MIWKEFTIGELCIKVTDGSHYSPKELSEGYPMFSVKDMVDNGFDYSAVKRISEKDFIKIAKGDCKPKKDDVLIAKDGSYLKHVFVCTEEKNEVILSSIAILRPDKKKIDSFYFKYLLISVKGMMESFVSGSALPRIVLKDFKKMKLTVPPPPTQRRIASILSAYDDLIEVNNQRIKLLEETARELYKEWFVRMRFPATAGKPGHKEAKFVKGLPEGWKVTELHELGKIFTGKTPPTKVKDYYGGDIPFIKTPDLHKNQFVFETEEYLTEKGNNTQKKSTLPKGSICVSCIGTGGIVGITTAEKSQTNQQINSLIPKDIKSLEFLFYSITDLRETIQMYGYTGATMTNLSKGKFEKLKIVFANKELVYKYSDVVKPMFEQIQTLQQQNTQLRQIRDRLLPRLISGKLEVK